MFYKQYMSEEMENIIGFAESLELCHACPNRRPSENTGNQECAWAQVYSLREDTPTPTLYWQLKENFQGLDLLTQDIKNLVEALACLGRLDCAARISSLRYTLCLYDPNSKTSSSKAQLGGSTNSLNSLDLSTGCGWDVAHQCMSDPKTAIIGRFHPNWWWISHNHIVFAFN